MSKQTRAVQGLDTVGLCQAGQIHWNLSPAALFEEAVQRREGRFAAGGPFVSSTAPRTGRSPNDKFVVREPSSEQHVDWGSNRPLDTAAFETLHREMATYLEDKTLCALDGWAGADPVYRLPIRVINEFAWRNAFARNYLLPLQGVLPMNCSANVGEKGDAALFFGLSGTGKTTLSSDPQRRLIGDDEHGWSDQGVFSFEGGCYAKVIKLSAEAEPQIDDATRRFGAILENVAIDGDTRALDFDDDSRTENTRGSYPRGFVENFTTFEKGVPGPVKDAGPKG